MLFVATRSHLCNYMEKNHNLCLIAQTVPNVCKWRKLPSGPHCSKSLQKKILILSVIYSALFDQTFANISVLPFCTLPSSSIPAILSSIIALIERINLQQTNDSLLPSSESIDRLAPRKKNFHLRTIFCSIEI